MPKVKKLGKVKPKEDIEKTKSEIVEKSVVYVRFMHMGKGRLVVKPFSSIESAREFGKTIKPWLEAGIVKYPELVFEPGLLEIIS